MNLYEVYTFGNGDYIAVLFNSIAMMVGGKDYYGLVKVAGIAGFLYVMLQGFLSQKVNPTYIITYTFVLMVLLYPKINIGIVDRLRPVNNVVVGNVPMGVGIFAHFTSKIGDGLTRMAEKNFSLPNNLKYQDNGLAGSLSLLYQSKKFTFIPGNTKTDLDTFLKNCTFYELASGQKNIQELIRSQDIMEYLNTDSSRFTTLHPGNGTDTNVVTCKAAYKELAGRIKAEYPVYLGILERTLFDEVTGTLETKLSNVYNYLGKISANGSDIIIQNAMINMVNESFLADAQLSGIDVSLGALSVAQAEQQQRTSWFTTSALAKKVLPLLRSILEGLLYGLFPFVFILFLLPSGFKYILAYLTNLFWIQSWGFFFAILNLGINIAARRDVSAVTDGLGLGISMIDHVDIFQTSADFINMSGAMAMSVPLISLGIISGSGYALVNSIEGMGKGTSDGASAASSSVGTGNLSYGNMHVNTESYDNVSAHTHNTVWDTQIGANSTFYERTQMITGNNIDQYGVADHPAVSYHVGTGPINISNGSAISRAYNHSVGKVESNIATETQSLQNRFGSMISEMGSYAHSTQTGSSRDISENSGRQLSYGDLVQEATNSMKSEGMDEKVAKDRANQIVGAAAVNVMLAGNGIKGQTSWNFKGGELEAYNKAVSTMKSMGASTILQDMKTYASTSSMGKTNSEGHSYSDNSSASFNKAKELLGSLTDSYSKLNNIQDQYNEMRKDDFGMTTQLTGDFNHWYKEKYGDTKKYYEGMTNNQTGEQLIFEYMSERVFNGKEIFGNGAGIGAREQATEAGVPLNKGINEVQYGNDVRPDWGNDENGLKKEYSAEINTLNKNYSAGGKAFYIKPKEHLDLIHNKEISLEKKHKSVKDSAEFNRDVDKSIIHDTERKVKHYKDNIFSEEVSKPVSTILDKINQDMKDLKNDPSWGECDPEKKLTK